MGMYDARLGRLGSVEEDESGLSTPEYPPCRPPPPLWPPAALPPAARAPCADALWLGGYGIGPERLPPPAPVPVPPRVPFLVLGLSSSPIGSPSRPSRSAKDAYGSAPPAPPAPPTGCSLPDGPAAAAPPPPPPPKPPPNSLTLVLIGRPPAPISCTCIASFWFSFFSCWIVLWSSSSMASFGSSMITGFAFTWKMLCDSQSSVRRGGGSKVCQKRLGRKRDAIVCSSGCWSMVEGARRCRRAPASRALRSAAC